MSDTAATIRLVDNDEGEISIIRDGVEIRGWSYKNREEQMLKMRMAREFCEGWYSGFDVALTRAQTLFAEAMAATEPAKH